MRVILEFFVYLLVFMALWLVTANFYRSADTVTWVVAIGVATWSAWYGLKKGGKHDD